MKYNRVNIDARGIFYRETGNADAPALLLLHGFPTSSHMFRDLMPRLADQSMDSRGFSLVTGLVRPFRQRQQNIKKFVALALE